MKLARDKLAVYGSSENEIENAKNEDGVRKAKRAKRRAAANREKVRFVAFR